MDLMGSLLLLLLACISHSAIQSHAAATATWEQVHKQTASAAGTAQQPSIRYGHASDRHGSKMLVNLGYYYDRDSNTATWLSDTWEMDMEAPPYAWTKLNAGISQEDARQAYSSSLLPHAPTGRFGHTSAVHNDTVYVYGGHDGGISRHGRQNYEPGYDFDELWAFSVAERSWRLVASPELRHPPGHQPPGPGKRYLHASAIVGDLLIIYGGLAEGQGDVWAIDVAAAEQSSSPFKWELLSVEVPRVLGGPGRRVGHTLTAIDQPSGKGGAGERVRGVLLFGGRFIEGSETALDAKPWFFDLGTKAWRPAPPLSPAAAAPGGRKYHGEASAWVRVAPDGSLLPSASPKGKGSSGAAGSTGSTYVHVTVIFGGTVTTPGLTCTSEAWLGTLDCGATSAAWQRLPELQPAVYDVRGAASADGAVFAYGGHLCTESRGALPFYYTNAVSRLDLVKLGLRVPASACRVPAALLPRQRGQGEASMQAEEL